MSDKFDSWLTGYAQAVVKGRWLVLILSLLATAAMLQGATKLTFSTDYRVYFGPDNPQLVAFEAMQDIYTKNDNTLVVVEPPGDDAYNATTLKLVREFTDRAWELPYVLRVDSLANYQHTEALGDDLHVADLIPEPELLTSDELTRIRDIALNEPLLYRRLTSAEGHVVTINVTHQFPGIDPINEVPEAVAATRALREEFHQRYPDHKLYLSGSNMLNNAFAETSKADMATLYPTMYGLLILVLYLLLRSVSATFASVLVIMFATGGAMGLAGHVGIGLTTPSTVAPIVVTSLAVADAVHILVSMFASMREGKNRDEALVAALRLNFMPVFLTSITTAIGLLTLNFADSPPLKDLGNISAMGAMVAWGLSITLLPAVIALLPIRPPKQSNSPLARYMEAFGRWVVAKRKPVLVSSLLVCIGLMALVPLNEPNDMFARYFDHRIEFRNDTDFMVDNVTGLYTMEFSLPAPNGVSDPDYLDALERFKAYWEENPKVLQISSIADIFKRLNKNMHGDDPDWYRLPDQADLAAQYLLLYEFSLPFGLDLTNTINLDKSASRFVVVFEHLKSKETRELARNAQAWLEENAPEQAAIAVSPAVMFSFIAERNFLSMAKGVPLALFGISILLIFALRSLKFGLISLVPNLFPLGMAFGIWAIYDGEINFAMSFAMGVVMGIIVDDTIHFMSKYLRARREQGLSPEEAIAYSFRTVGTALIVTSIVLIAGFLVLSYSAFYPSSSMSMVTMLAIICALAVDFLLLPALLLMFDKEPVGNTANDIASESNQEDSQNETAFNPS